MRLLCVSLEEISPALVAAAARRLGRDYGGSLSQTQSCVGEAAVRLFCRRVGISNVSIERQENGKPVLSRAGLHFNLSHSGEFVVCAFSKEPVGVDVERCAPRGFERVLRLFSEEERAEVLAAREPLVAFYHLWTAKESALKRTGEGLSGVKRVRFLREEVRTFEFESKKKGERYVLSVCAPCHEIEHTSLEFLNGNDLLQHFLTPASF